MHQFMYSFLKARLDVRQIILKVNATKTKCSSFVNEKFQDIKFR